MRKVYITAQNCFAGMILSDDICSDTNVCLIRKGAYITEELEKKIKRFRLKPILVEVGDDVQVEVLENFESDIEKAHVSQEIVAAYISAKVEAKGLLDTVACGEKFTSEDVDMVSQRIQENIKDSFDVLKCIDSVRSIDEYIYSHCVNVSLLAATLGKWLGYPQDETDELAQAGLLHDVGKSKIDLCILNKEGSLSSDELGILQNHVTLSYRTIEKLEGVSHKVRMGVLMHHEREDGSGYPLNARSGQIHKYAKVLAVVDVYDALTSNKPYRERKSVFQALSMMLMDMKSQLDYKMLCVFAERILSHYIGDYVVLSSGETGQLVHINTADLLNPLVKVDNTIIDLSTEYDLQVMDLLRNFVI